MNQSRPTCKHIIIVFLIVGCILLLSGTLALLYKNNSSASTATEPSAPTEPQQILNVELMNRYDQLISDAVASAKKAALSVKKRFWINSDAAAAPVPNHDNYGTTDDPSTLQWLIDEAAELLDGQELTFRTDIELCPGSEVTYYYDDTILAITWKQVIFSYVYTICEVKIADASQFRRHIGESTFGSNVLSTTTDMASKVNAVAAMSGDYYRGRQYGIVVYDSTVYQVASGNYSDTCYIDYDGNFHFTYRGEITDKESAQQYVDAHNINFSLAFGPVLVADCVRCEPDSYALGEVNDHYARAAICQKDQLHYLLVTGNSDGAYYQSPTIHTFAEAVSTFNVQSAYALDGGQTGSIAMDGKLMNPTYKREQRRISDIVYFGSAIPNQQTDE